MARPIVFILPMLVVLAGCPGMPEPSEPPPLIEFFNPESLAPLPVGTTEIQVSYAVENLILDPGDEVVEGQGKVAFALDAVPDAATDIVSAETMLTFQLPGDLPSGPHRLLAQAVQGDGTPYDNWESLTDVVFFIEDVNPDKPQIAFIEPGPFSKHYVGEPLDVYIGVRNFSLAATGEDCHVEEGCDPFDLDSTCMFGPACSAVSTTGNVKIFGQSDYPACLSDMPVGCEYDYLASITPESGSASEVTATIDGAQLGEAGTITLSAALSYHDHGPYPNEQYIIYDQITIELVE